MKKSFYSKILLFGEYSVIKNSMALAMPYPLFEGKLVFPHSYVKNRSPDPELKEFSQHLRKLTQKKLLPNSFDLDSFEFDIGQGLIFESTIPPGLGLGSSGALCAAVFDRYCLKKQKDDNSLRRIFSAMESHFHGVSSGLDPMISYHARAILIKKKEILNQINIPLYDQGRGGIFLLNTGRQRRTEPLVNLFLEKSKDLKFNNNCQSILIPKTNRCIIHFLEKNLEYLLEDFKHISSFQWQHFRPMIPTLFQDIWQEGLHRHNYFLKLCGAGGGGFLMGITRDIQKTSRFLGPCKIRPLFRFNFPNDHSG
ncbi:MAG: mevalonate kinase [Halobacteriovoraceae bacterium]|nr:mevalonate kinase [Halobacteriovoraceae bacterium]